MLNAFSKFLLVGPAVLNPLFAGPTYANTSAYKLLSETYTKGDVYTARLVGEGGKPSLTPSSGLFDGFSNYTNGVFDGWFYWGGDDTTNDNYGLPKGLSGYRYDTLYNGNSTLNITGLKDIKGGVDNLILARSIRLTCRGYDVGTNALMPTWLVSMPSTQASGGIDWLYNSADPIFFDVSYKLVASIYGYDPSGNAIYDLTSYYSMRFYSPSYGSLVLLPGAVACYSFCDFSGGLPNAFSNLTGDRFYRRGYQQSILLSDDTGDTSNFVYVNMTNTARVSSDYLVSHGSNRVYFGVASVENVSSNVPYARPYVPSLSWTSRRWLPAQGYLDQKVEDARQEGYSDGYNFGHKIGYDDGYDKAEKYFRNNATRNFLGNAFTNLASLLSIEIFPGISLAFFVFIPVVLGVLCIFLKFLS